MFLVNDYLLIFLVISIAGISVFAGYTMASQEYKGQQLQIDALEQRMYWYESYAQEDFLFKLSYNDSIEGWELRGGS